MSFATTLQHQADLLQRFDDVRDLASTAPPARVPLPPSGVAGNEVVIGRYDVDAGILTVFGLIVDQRVQGVKKLRYDAGEAGVDLWELVG